MTKLSINVNKVALLRNSRGRNYPSVTEFAGRCLDLGAHGITLHPRPDQRHARYSDIHDLKNICEESGAELNVEGYPSRDFLAEVRSARPTQCTLVPDSPDQLTSDHGWHIAKHEESLRGVISDLRSDGIRVSLFMDYDSPEIEAAKAIGADRIELYTEPYAAKFGSKDAERVFAEFRNAASRAQNVGLGVNAGHDLNLRNLTRFLSISNVLEVSIGHALIVECIELGVSEVISSYLSILSALTKRTPKIAGER